jgi:hypothetical protein
MTPAESYAVLERTLASALLSAHPAQRLAELAGDPELPGPLRRALAAARPEGLDRAARRVAEHRAARLLAGAPELAAWRRNDPEGFERSFAAYHRDVAPTAFRPEDEAAAFARWRAGTQRGA